MTIAPWIIGFILGLALASVTWIVLGRVIESQTNRNGRIERNDKANALDMVRKLELVTMPLIGAAIGYFVFGGAQ